MPSELTKRDPHCSRCPLSKTADYVCLLGDERSPKKVLLVGEAPGVQEEKAGRLFIGRAGRLLRQSLERCDFSEEDYSIINSVCCRPPANRTPKAAEIKACKYWVDQVIRDVNPRYVLIMGNPALKSVLNLTGITKYRGKPQEIDGVIYLPTFHPSAVLRDPTKEGAFEADLQLLADIVDNKGVPREEGLNPVVVNNRALVKEMLDDLNGGVSFDIETTCLYPWDKIAQVNLIGFGTRRTQWILPASHFCPEASVWNKKQLERILRQLTEALQDCVVIAHNGKFDSLWMKVHYGVDWEINFDTMLAHYLLNENSLHNLEYLAQIYLGAVHYDLDPRTAPWDKLIVYHAKDLYYTRKLKYLFARRLHKEANSRTIFQRILMPCSTMFTEAELNGFYVDVPEMGKVEKKLRAQVAELERKLKKYGDINFNSTQQLANLLFKELKPIEYTGKGAPSTKESVLKRLKHPITDAMLEHRSATKLLGTYIKGWKPFLVGNLIHPSFKLHGAVTGRASCEHPNLQQVPRDSSIRSLITAPKGWVFVEADLSQIELRIAAELSGERNMLDTFYSGKDIHWRTAIREISRGGGEAELVVKTAQQHLGRKVSYDEAVQVIYEMGVKKASAIDKRWGDLRYKAKAVNFGFLYGMWHKKFRDYAYDEYGIQLTEAQAKASREAYFDMYPGLEEWHERQRRYARRWGYVLSLSGRKRRLPQAQLPRDCPERREAERQAINTPVQSFANELNFMAALQIREEFNTGSSNKVRITGTVHDSIHFWIRQAHVEKVVPRILEIMKHPALLDTLNIRIRVPVEAEAKIGPWSKGKELDQWVTSSR